MQGHGTFIVIEGTDGAGKATQFQRLADLLRHDGYEVATFDFPRYSQPSSYFVKRYLNGHYGTAAHVGPYTGSLFYALDRFDAAASVRQALDAGKIVLANRFTGSNMAHQGTKFRDAHERRGFFVWLDNLEFEILKIPRPALNIVLRVPAKVAQELIGQKPQRGYTDQSHDLHEADLQHLERSVEVYDELCQLFPKDYVRIDCVRDNQLLGVEAIGHIVREKVRPLLPKPHHRPADKANGEAPTNGIQSHAAYEERGPQLQDAAGSLDIRETDAPATALSVDHISRLAAIHLRAGRLGHYSQPVSGGHHGDNTASFFTPPDFDPATKKAYRQAMEELLGMRADLVRRLEEYCRQAGGSADSRQAALSQAAESLLPVASTTAVSLQADGPEWPGQLARLLGDALPEVQHIGKQLLEYAGSRPPLHTAPSAAGDLQPQAAAAIAAYRAANRQAVGKLASQHLARHHTGAHDQIADLTDVWPRNELDLVADMLYEHSDMPLRQLRAEIAGWPYEKKLEVVQTYIGQRQNRHQRPGLALEKVHYSWDLLCDSVTFRDLLRHRLAEDLEWQEVSPRYGYDIPQLVEEAGLAERFESCFDRSLQLYSLLQRNGYGLEAQYATLCGHRLRCKLTCNGREAFRLLEQRTSQPGYRKLTSHMHDKIREAHPLLAEAMRFTSQGWDPELTHTDKQ